MVITYIKCSFKGVHIQVATVQLNVYTTATLYIAKKCMNHAENILYGH